MSRTKVLGFRPINPPRLQRSESVSGASELQGLVRRINSKSIFQLDETIEFAKLPRLSLPEPLTPTVLSHDCLPWNSSNLSTRTFFEVCNCTELEDYEIGDVLGTGASGEVKYAIFKPAQQPVAIKCYEKSRMLTKNQYFQAENWILKALEHQNIVRCFDTIQERGRSWIVLEYLAGESLHSFLQKRHKLGEAQAKYIFRQILSAVSYCHRKKVVHGDLKAENVLISQEGTVKIIDFGLAYIQNSRQKRYKGTLEYMAPEIVSKQLFCGFAADTWALGVLLYKLLTGNYPFKGMNVTETKSKIKRGVFHQSTELSKDAWELIGQMLHVVPEKRPTARELVLHPWIGERKL